MNSVRNVLLLFFICVMAKDVNALENRPRRQMAGDVLPSFGTAHDLPAGVMPFTIQACEEEPKIDHARVRCGHSGCRVLCEKGYKVASGLAFTTLQCDHSNGLLTIDGQPWTLHNITCLPYCGLDGCYNGGECVQPQVCECVRNHTGEHCEIPPETIPENPASPEVTNDSGAPQQTPMTPDPMTCPEPDFPVVNAEITRSDEQLIVRCKAGHVFAIGGTIAFVQCREGVWDHPKGVFSADGALVCQGPRCDPPCQHGGTCLPEGVCDCPYKYWGSACQRMMCAYPDAKHLSHSSLGGVHSRMKIQCHPRHRMRSGRRSQTILCHQGHWTLSGRGPLSDNDVKCYPVDKMPAPQ